MLLSNNSVDKYIKGAKNRIIQIYGEPDAGKTTVLFDLIGQLTADNKICAYITPQLTSFRYEYFNRFASNHDLCVIIEAADAAILSSVFPMLAEKVNYIFIDDFLRYIIRKSKSDIRKTLSMISSQAYKHDICVVLDNELRYNPLVEKQLPAYEDILRRYISESILVRKHENELDIVYETVEAKR